MKRIILFGMPGAGKGTQALKIMEKFNFLHIPTGDMIRKVVAEETEVGKKLAKIINDGKLIPDEIIIQMVEELIHKREKVEGYLLDGFPRNINQARELSKIPVEKEYILYLKISGETALKRILGRQSCGHCGAIYNYSKEAVGTKKVCDKCGNPLKLRDDDHEKTVMKRLRVFEDETHPVLDFYQTKRGYSVINAELDENRVFEQILSKLQ